MRLGACPDGQRETTGANSIQRGPTLNHVDSVARTFFIDVGRSSIVAYRFRFPVLRGDTVVKALIHSIITIDFIFFTFRLLVNSETVFFFYQS